MAVITQAEARVYLPGLSADDSTVATLITRADAILAAWCGFPPADEGRTGLPTFEDVSYTFFLTADGGRDLQLPVWPIVSLASEINIQDAPDEVFDGTWRVSTSDYVVRERGILRLKQSSTHGYWGRGDKSIKVVYTAGFETPPEDLKQCVAEYVGVLWGLRSAPHKRSVQTPQGGGDMPTGEIPASIRQRLRRFELTSARGMIP